jgi:hypothetical protein
MLESALLRQSGWQVLLDLRRLFRVQKSRRAQRFPAPDWSAVSAPPSAPSGARPVLAAAAGTDGSEPGKRRRLVIVIFAGSPLQKQAVAEGLCPIGPVSDRPGSALYGHASPGRLDDSNGE